MLTGCTVLLFLILFYPEVIFVYCSSQWDATLQCNVDSHWLDIYTKRSLFIVVFCVHTDVKCTGNVPVPVWCWNRKKIGERSLYSHLLSADAPATQGARSSTQRLLTLQDKRVFICHDEIFLLPAPSLYREILENDNTLMSSFSKWIQPDPG